MISELLFGVKKFIGAAQLNLPANYLSLIKVFFSALVIAIYAIFIWKFYIFLSRKDIIKLNLSKYNYSEHPVTSRFFAIALYIIEYIIILPFVILFWFAVLTSIFFVLGGEADLERTIVMVAAVVAAIRIVAYYKEGLAQELAKLLPLTLLGIFLIDQKFSSAQQMIQNILQIPDLALQIGYFFILIAALELILRLVYLAVTQGEETDEKEDE